MMQFRQFFSGITSQDIPETWDSIESFCDWYIEKGMPFMPPPGVEVFLSDDATAVCLFRKGQFQVELYLVHPNPLVQKHEHPGVNLIKCVSQGSDDNGYIGHSEGILKSGGVHGLGSRDNQEKGFMIMAFEQWHPNITPTTVAASWKGKTAGPKHEALIRRLNPNALVIEGYADTTRTMDDLKELLNK